MEKWDLEAEQRRYIESSWTDHRPQSSEMRPSKPPRPSRWMIGIGVAAVVAMGSITALALMRARSRSSSPQALVNTVVAPLFSASVVSTPPPVDDQEKILRDRIMSAPNAVEAAKLCPLKDDINDIGAGTMLFTHWAAHKMTWDEISSRDNTTLGRVMKDPDAERGHHLCSSGIVIEIHAMKLDNGESYYLGGIMDLESRPIRFLAVHSTGDIVAASNARVCGTVVGTSSYDNVSGGQTQAVQVVGMLDLPENHAASSRRVGSKTETHQAFSRLTHGSAAHSD